jgi:hypothetical protein
LLPAIQDGPVVFHPDDFDSAAFLHKKSPAGGEIRFIKRRLK